MFAGREWSVKTGTGGPGPNNWSDDPSSVWIDGTGQLHLRIRKVGATWYCAEVDSVRPTRYGTHRFYLASRVDTINRNAVFSPFLYKDDTHEIDIEFSKWSRAAGLNTQYVLQPSATSGNRHQFTTALAGDYSTHYYDWQASGIHFKSFNGHYTEPPDGSYLIQEWTYTGSDNPSATLLLKAMINLWLYRGKAPSDGQEIEVVVTSADIPSPPPCISGRITRSDTGAGVDGVTITFSSGGGTAVTSGGGCYTNTVSYGWSGAVIPSYGSYSFSPSSQSYSTITLDQTGQDYTGTAPNHAPNTPILLSPTNGARGMSLTPPLVSSAFADPDLGDTHAGSQWQVDGNSNFSSLVWDSGDVGASTYTNVPAGLLDYSTLYCWHVRYKDNHGEWSGWAEAFWFATAGSPQAPFIDIATTSQVYDYNQPFPIAGTNNSYVVGSMWVTNTCNGAHVVFPALQSWTCQIELGESNNMIIAYGSNTAGTVANDTVIVFGVPEPVPGMAACILAMLRRFCRR